MGRSPTRRPGRVAVEGRARDRKHGLDHALDVGVDLVIPECNLVNPKARSAAPRVVPAPNVEAMVLALHLDDEAGPQAGEIEDGGIGRHLPPETIALRTQGAEVNPQADLLPRHPAAQAGERSSAIAWSPFRPGLRPRKLPITRK